MTWQEAISVLKMIETHGSLSTNAKDEAIKALEEVQQYRAIGTVSELQDLVIGINALADSQFSAEDMAKLVIDMKSLYEYRQIGTPEECRAAVEKQKTKKPKHTLIKLGKHTWRKNKDGDIDDFAWDFDYHNGVVCEVCGETVCVHCNPKYDELTDCEKEYWSCSFCGKKLYCKNKYCDCGQKLDWSDEE